MKLQTLLAKGAALGLHFIFASQGFTSGTRGLNDFSKKQVQERIAMKTEYNEIKETLDLKSASDDDKAMMEQLPVHHALVRTPVDERGNHIKLTQVMYIQDYTHQEAMIDRIRRMVHPAPRYELTGIITYPSTANALKLTICCKKMPIFGRTAMKQCCLSANPAECSRFIRLRCLTDSAKIC